MSKPDMLSIRDLKDIIGERPVGFKCAFVGGSRATVDPPPTDTDMDIFLHCDSVINLVEQLECLGWETGGEYVTFSDDFCTLRLDEYNILVFSNAYEFGAVWGATCVAKHRNLKLKEDRYALFEQARTPWRLT